MDPKRRGRIDEIVAEAWRLGAAERDAFLIAACGSDAALRVEVESMVRRGDEADVVERTAAASEPEEWSPPVPAGRVGPYEIESEIGRGGMGVVLRASDPRLGRAVALKALPLELARDPTSRAQVLGGKALACYIALCTVMTLLLTFGHLAMKMRVGSVPLLGLAVLSTAAGFTGLMMLLSIRGKTIQAVSGLGWGANLAMSMTGGGMIPLAFMPPWLRSVSHLSPVKWAILALEGAIWRDFTLAEMLMPRGILLAVGIAAFSLGATIDSKREA